MEKKRLSSIKDADIKNIEAFVKKWRGLCTTDSTDILKFLGEHPERDGYFGDDAWAIGLDMDCGHSFAKKYPQIRIDNTNRFKRDLQRVYSAQILGNLIFSQWRYYNHWTYDEMPDPEWFIAAFERFLYLCRKMHRR